MIRSSCIFAYRFVEYNFKHFAKLNLNAEWKQKLIVLNEHVF